MLLGDYELQSMLIIALNLLSRIGSSLKLATRIQDERLVFITHESFKPSALVLRKILNQMNASSGAKYRYIQQLTV